MAPVILIGVFAQRHIVKGLTVGAVKGGGRR
jgi:ABC-type glycerol-3-phosphate transport system permease component